VEGKNDDDAQRGWGSQRRVMSVPWGGPAGHGKKVAKDSEKAEPLKKMETAAETGSTHRKAPIPQKTRHIYPSQRLPQQLRKNSAITRSRRPTKRQKKEGKGSTPRTHTGKNLIHPRRKETAWGKGVGKEAVKTQPQITREGTQNKKPASAHQTEGKERYQVLKVGGGLQGEGGRGKMEA